MTVSGVFSNFRLVLLAMLWRIHLISFSGFLKVQKMFLSLIHQHYHLEDRLAERDDLIVGIGGNITRSQTFELVRFMFMLLPSDTMTTALSCFINVIRARSSCRLFFLDFLWSIYRSFLKLYKICFLVLNCRSLPTKEWIMLRLPSGHSMWEQLYDHFFHSS